MSHWLRNIVAYAITAIAAAAALQWIGSPFVKTLVANLSTIVLALLAINVQTMVVIATKLREVLDRTDGQAVLSIRELRLAIYEQAVLSVAALCVQSTVDATNMQLSPTTLAVSSLFILFASLHIFLDITLALLVALFPER